MAALTDKVAVVTGASRGIGRGIALELAKRGASVIVNYNASASTANEVVEEIKSLNGEATAVQADVSTEDGANALIKAAVDTYGKIDILINNAGTTRDNVIMIMKPEDFDAVIQSNLRSTWLCSKAAVRSMMRKRYGRIVNLTSISGVRGQAGQTNYSASKAGIIGLTKALAKEVGARGITVNAVAPGFVLTDLTKDLPQDLVDQMMPLIPLGKWASIEDIAFAVAFLASDEAAMITGEVLTVDGGMSA
ncbi:MAG: 3-oxoacyl-[acyl-carrier-protein] reductase [Anaerolineaceae bacterium]|nr:3-oxoacyl-[acyl-carrier-protein] reductase [Anaerolineaceae bacterium]